MDQRHAGRVRQRIGWRQPAFRGALYLVSSRMTTNAFLLTVMTFSMCASASVQAEQAVKVSKVEAFDVIGIECRTNNASEASGKGCIGEQWKRLMSESLLQHIPERSDNDVIAVYTGYASDKDGDYTYILGARVKPGATAPAGMVKTTLKPGRFAVFTSEKGPVQKVVLANWQRVWRVPPSEPGGDRLYESDFELYDQRAADVTNAQMDIFIRIR